MSATPNFQPSGHQRHPELPSAFARDCAFAAENVEAFALGALPEEEVARVERHVSSCPRCAHLLDQSAGVIAFLPFLAEPVAVPATALAGVFVRIERDQPQSATASLPNLNPWEADEPARSWTIPSSREAYAGSIGASGIAASARKRRVNWDVWAAPLAAMPLVLALAIVGGWAMNTRSNLQDQKSALHAAQKENQQLSAQLLTYPSATSTAVDEIQAADFSLDSMNSSNARGALTQLSNSKGVAVQVWNLPTSVKTCEIEVETMDGHRTTVGMLTINGSGSGNCSYALDKPLDAYRYVHVIPVASGTGGSTAPTPDLLMAQINSNLGETGGTEANSSSR